MIYNIFIYFYNKYNIYRYCFIIFIINIYILIIKKNILYIILLLDMKISLQMKGRIKKIDKNLLEKLKSIVNAEIVEGFDDDAEIVVFSGHPEPGKKTVFMQSLSAGVNHVDFSKINDKILICSNADAYSIPVAEHVFALILSHLKKICKFDYEIKNNIYKREFTESLYDMSIGILGYGGIGSEVARLAKAFNMKTYGFGRTVKKDNNIDYFTKDPNYIYENSDIIIISLPLNKYTVGFINKNNLNKIKGNIIVNVGRSEIVNHDDMLNYLKNNKNKFFLTDVWWNEPEINDKIPENVVITPHIAGMAKNYIDVPLIRAFNNVKNYLNGKPENIVNRNDYI